MADGIAGGAMLMYAAVGVYVWALAQREGWMKRRWLGLVLLVLIWPLFLMDVKINRRASANRE